MTSLSEVNPAERIQRAPGNDGPEISVLLPFRDAERTLEECLDSVLSQLGPSFEVVAVDDGSQDRSSELVARRGHYDPRLRLMQPGKVGLVQALNHGLHHCRSSLVARMDADDRMFPGRLSQQYSYFLEHRDVDLVACQVVLFADEAPGEGFQEYIRWQNNCLTPEEIAAEIYWESPLAHPSVMFRRERVAALGGYREGAFPEDYELWLRMHQAGCRMTKLPTPLLAWRDGPTRLTRTDPRYARDAFDRLRAEYLARDPRLQQGRALIIWGAGRRTRRRAELLLRQGFQVAAWIDVDPNKLGGRHAGAEVMAPHRLAEWTERPLVLVYVTSRGARESIAPLLESMGYRRGADYFMVG
ncbi:MAG: glycosyltransferase [Magnetococcales bacterium]|nr:glycosyltransferase [Magnetococcales bacterium]